MINKLILGTVQFGLNYGINNSEGKVSEKEVEKILLLAKSKGITILDTANAYGNSLEVIGNFHKQHPDKKFEIINKFVTLPANQTLEKQIREELKVLKTEHFHGYMYHNFPFYKENQETLAVLSYLKNDGLIQKIGISCYTNEEMEEIADIEEVDFVQFPYNLFDNLLKRGKAIDQLKNAGKEIHIRSVYLQGFFFIEPEKLKPSLSPLSKYLGHVREISKNYSIQELAFNYPFKNKNIDNIVIGVDNVAQLEQNINLFDEKIVNSEILNQIDKIDVQEANLLNPSNW